MFEKLNNVDELEPVLDAVEDVFGLVMFPNPMLFEEFEDCDCVVCLFDCVFPVEPKPDEVEKLNGPMRLRPIRAFKSSWVTSTDSDSTEKSEATLLVGDI